MKLKVEKNIVYWHNGKKWLIKETCKNEKVAKLLLKDLEKQNASNKIS